jgi:type II secretory ATPase GspE/PulE/Tfp pilus assembly ATPase PilB-like protein
MFDMTKFDDSLSNSKMAELYAQEEERSIQSSAPRLGFDYIDLKSGTINPEAIIVISEQKARAAEIVAFELKRHSLFLAAKNPNSPKIQSVIQELQNQRYTINMFICSSASLEYAWKRYNDVIDSSAERKGVFEIDSSVIDDLIKNIKTIDDVVKILQKINTINNSRRISETLELLFASGLALKASDIHIEPEQNSIRLRYRFDGVLHDVASLDSYIKSRLFSRLKLLSGMVLNTKAEAQDGRFTFDTGDRKVEVRSSIIPGSFGESIVMRLLDPTVASFSLEKINLNPYIKKVIEQELKKPNGLIITTGPTGSGKTTALYAFLQETHEEGVKIITIENPVEYKLDGIVQTQTDENYTFASGLRAILRQDPDIIMIGEIRDHEVAETAIHAAQTGHLVFSTLHTNSAVAGFARLIDLGIDPRIMGSSINIIVGQRLVRQLCDKCKEKYEASSREKLLIEHVMSTHPHPIEIPQPVTLYRAVGCSACGNTGYKGRIGIFEGIAMTEEVEEAVLRDPREHIISEAAKPQGIPTMVEDGIEKAIKGLTSLKELERVIELPYLNEESSPTTPLPSPLNTIEEDNQSFKSHII